ncbi:MAG: DinB family protein [Bacteroidia bacterium]
MNRPELISIYVANHKAFHDYILSLNDAEFLTSRNDKWTPAQQLDHIVLCTKPLVQILGAKDVILSKFGKATRPCMTYAEVITLYTEALAKGGKAPDRFVPPQITLAQRSALSGELQQQLLTIAQQLGTYSEEDLDTLILPHPLLGMLTVREMMYLMAHHATHHLEQTKANLKA